MAIKGWPPSILSTGLESRFSLSPHVCVSDFSEEKKSEITSMFNSVQNTTKLLLGGNSIRAQKTYAIDYCSSAFTTEGIV
jgi:hypothetical protein